ncbi:MAG: two-component system cell cycle sensor histidine kinase/response regulator CckA [Planctomycetota bacterium]
MADGPKTAHSIADRHKGQIDALVTHVVMPILDGNALAKKLLQSRPDLKVLYIFCYRAAVSVGDDLSSQMAFLEKPFGTQDLLRELSCLLQQAVAPSS